MRTFIAVDVPEGVRDSVSDYIDSVKDLFDENAIKWIRKENLHFTVKFLGDILKSDVEAVEKCVEATAKEFDSFSLGIAGAGFFPDEQKPRIVWVGTDGGAYTLLDVFQNLENCLEQEGFDRESRMFSPHLTIGRVRKNYNIVAPKDMPDFAPITFEVDGLSVMKSTLTPEGPIYEKLAECKL